MADFITTNALATIAFSLAMIVGLLIYIAFYKDRFDKPSPKSKQK